MLRGPMDGETYGTRAYVGGASCRSNDDRTLWLWIGGDVNHRYGVSIRGWKALTLCAYVGGIA